MGARRIPHHLRDHLIDLMQTAMVECRTESGEIDTTRLTETVMASLPVELDRDTLRDLRDESVRIVIDSLSSDIMRDSRRRMTIAGKQVRLRKTYRIPREQGSGLWTVKDLDDLTEEDIERLETYHRQQAMKGLQKFRALRQLRGFVHEPKAQHVLPVEVQ